MAELNGVMMQYFHWYSPADGSLWNEIVRNAPMLAERGVTSLWIPPAYKAFGGAADVGYAVYDMFDVGEFDQKGTVRTKYGTRDEFLAACAAADAAGIRMYADAVFNHRMGADAVEEVRAIPLNPDNRNEVVGEPTTIEAWTHFTFPGRKGTHSAMEWRWHHFKAVDHTDPDGYKIYLFEGKSFDREVDGEKGNYDYLMGCDVDLEHDEVLEELLHWGEWFVTTTGVDGFRFDAVKHVKAEFFRDWMRAVSARTGRELFAVGEYWSYDIETLDQFIECTDGRITLFDAPLHNNFHVASQQGRAYDLRTIFDDTLVQHHPTHAVTLVENHDSQPLQALESVVDPWFKPMAYAMILLRRDGYPCLFHADYFGATYSDTGRDGAVHDIVMPSHQVVIDAMLDARHAFAYGEQRDYFDSATCIGWTRRGTDEHPGGLAVLLSNADADARWMDVGHVGATYRDCTGQIAETVTTNADGWGEFRCPGGAVSVWVPVPA